MSFEKLTVVVIAGELSIGTVVVFVQLFSININCVTSINPNIVSFFFDMILILSDEQNRSIIYFWKCKVNPVIIACAVLALLNTAIPKFTSDNGPKSTSCFIATSFVVNALFNSNTHPDPE